MSIFSKIFGDANARSIGDYRSIVLKINELEPAFEKFSLEELKAKTQEFKKRLAEGGTLDDLLPEAFAAVREVSRRTLGQRHYDVQLIGGMVLHDGKIAEMRTGEGKTLVATLPSYLNALTGRGVHVVTVNDYLSRRDAVWMGQIHSALGLTVGVINHEQSYIYDAAHKSQVTGEALQEESFRVVHEFLRPVSRREAYEADITYGTNNEFGFDYLRDNMAYTLDQVVQAKGHEFAIVDEIDSILIDEARTPLIISAPDEDSGKLYQTFAKLVPRLKEGEDYTIDEKLKAVSIMEAGIEKVEQLLNIKNIYEEGGTRYVHHLQQALRAQALHHVDKEYVVKNGEVIIVDEFTGRLMPGRRWSEGLHQAIEAKEGVLVQKESRTYATITFQNYFRLYEKLAGMTGTAQTSAEEFHKVYKLDVVTVPTNKPMIRRDLVDRIYKTENGKIKAVVEAIKELHSRSQPVLIGTVSITKNEVLSAHLQREGIPHEVLNAKNHEREGEIIAQAGRAGAVTVATNLAGRGVDIILGGNPPDPEGAARVREVGGLHVIATERHEARRIDNQLRGRAGRQGDPGSSQFFVSAEDELVRVFGGDRLKNLMDRLGVAEDEAIENSLVSRAIEQAQSKIEGNNFDTRKYVLEYDDVMNKHRTAIYELRNEVLRSDPNADGVKDKIVEYLSQELDAMIASHMAFQSEEPREAKELADAIRVMIPTISDDQHAQIVETAKTGDTEKLTAMVHEYSDDAYSAREAAMGATTIRQLEAAVLLRVIDELWVDHLEQMEYLRDSVRLRAYGQRDPLVEYKIEGQRMFGQLQGTVQSQVANLIFKVGMAQPVAVKRKLEEGRANIAVGQQPQAGNAKQAKPEKQIPIHAGPHIGRNDPCPCGSGKKYKKCGLLETPEHKKLMAK
ncbi:MAG: preprotein translocase subunit SecA [Candidatus Yanofskybacteria bacterium RIFCSPLOWO2_01_FULL_49_25]|uniref:Protein translocase subunit SecA n=1 Tax=Candidatus Yanofskybacteria bacterium RIFCSPLOWO2_01_FULL_49_25 TaxID=1802701 RepID=A0A1F8GZZ1_9BACT|nr:MAG: preprotein translocase subunit SecA [Candidatus Yanofskybacteria bacterium RIFCSPLOWO2_01_FULL_49_25]